jgi:hypothetical protein
MVSLVESLDEKYREDEDEDQNFSFIVFVSCSPEAKRGLLPHVITLNDFNIGKSVFPDPSLKLQFLVRTYR